MHMPRQQHRVGDDVLVPQDHIVSQMAAHHQEIPVTDPRHAARLAAPVDRHMLADHIVLAQNHAARRGRIKSEILRLPADHCPAPNPRPFPHHHMPDELRMRLDLASSANLSRSVDHHIRPDHSRGVNLGTRINDGGGMDHKTAKKSQLAAQRKLPLCNSATQATFAARKTVRSIRRGGRVVYGSSLENWRGRNVTVGSNPTLSALVLWHHLDANFHRGAAPLIIQHMNLPFSGRSGPHDRRRGIAGTEKA
jgi:hypothetical protein